MVDEQTILEGPTTGSTVSKVKQILPIDDQEHLMRIYSFPNCATEILVPEEQAQLLDEYRHTRPKIDSVRVLPEDLPNFILSLPQPSLISQIILVDSTWPDGQKQDFNLNISRSPNIPPRTVIFSQAAKESSPFVDLAIQWSGIVFYLPNFVQFQQMYDLAVQAENDTAETDHHVLWVSDLSKLILANDYQSLVEAARRNPLRFSIATLLLEKTISLPSVFRIPDSQRMMYESSVGILSREIIPIAQQLLLSKINRLSSDALEDSAVLRLLVYLGTPDLFEQIENITRLNLSYSYYQSKHIKNIQNMSSLEYLNLSHNSQLQLDNAEIFANLTSLKSLNLSNTETTSFTISGLTCSDTLEELDLSNTAINDFGLSQLGRFDSLKILNLSGTRVTSEQIGILKELLPNCTLLV